MVRAIEEGPEIDDVQAKLHVLDPELRDVILGFVDGVRELRLSKTPTAA